VELSRKNLSLEFELVDGSGNIASKKSTPGYDNLKVTCSLDREDNIRALPDYKNEGLFYELFATRIKDGGLRTYK